MQAPKQSPSRPGQHHDGDETVWDYQNPPHWRGIITSEFAKGFHGLERNPATERSDYTNSSSSIANE
ncbi:MAG: hypothetical protein CMJ40_00575 [Phycisphaerae bacterium]|nr:hypothetical protein [Phycisphaerae bacterium]